MVADKPQAIVRSSAGIRELLFEEIQRLRDGISSPAEANAVARLAKEIGSTVKLELEVAKNTMRIAPSVDTPPALPNLFELGLKVPQGQKPQ